LEDNLCHNVVLLWPDAAPICGTEATFFSVNIMINPLEFNPFPCHLNSLYYIAMRSGSETPSSHSAGPGFESWPGDMLP